LLYALYYLGADALITGGHFGYRTLIQLMLPILDIGLCAILVPRYGAAGAALAATCTHIVLVTVLWTTLHILAREPLHAPPQGTATALPPTSQRVQRSRLASALSRPEPSAATVTQPSPRSLRTNAGSTPEGTNRRRAGA